MHIRCFARLLEARSNVPKAVYSVPPAAVTRQHRIAVRHLFGYRNLNPTTALTEQPQNRNEGAHQNAAHQEYSNSVLERRIADNVAKQVLSQIKGGNRNPDQRSTSFSLVVVIIGICGLTVLYMESLRSSLIEATGTAAGSLLHSKAFRDMSISFLKGLVADFLDSPEVHSVIQEKVTQLLKDSQEILIEQVIKVLETEDVTNKSFEFTQEITSRLCQDKGTIERVGQLLLDAIYTETAVNGAARWVADLSKREDTCRAIGTMFSDKVLADAKLQMEATNFCKQVTNQYLNDKETMQQSVAFIKSLLDRPALQAYLAQALLDIVKQSIYPRWLYPQSQELARYRHDIYSGAEKRQNSAERHQFI